MGKRLGFLWVKTLDNGDFYASGFLEDMGRDIHVKIVRNLFREKDSHADYVILRKEPQDVDEGGQAME